MANEDKIAPAELDLSELCPCWPRDPFPDAADYGAATVKLRETDGAAV